MKIGLIAAAFTAISAAFAIYDVATGKIVTGAIEGGLTVVTFTFTIATILREEKSLKMF